MNRPIKVALINMTLNTGYLTYYFILGALHRSWWLITLGSYYLILSLVRFAVIKIKENEHLISRFAGIMLMILTVPLLGTVILSVIRDRGMKFNMILMIAIAAYSFTKITIATVNFINSYRSASFKLITLRNISFADALVSIFALQRSMLVSFEGMTEAEIVIMNSILGLTVSGIVFMLGLNLLKTKNKDN